MLGRELINALCIGWLKSASTTGSRSGLGQLPESPNCRSCAIDAHLIDRLRKAGVRVSVNTDDSSPLATNLPAEYKLASAAFGVERRDCA